MAKLEDVLVIRCMTKALQGYEFYLKNLFSKMPAKEVLCIAMLLYSRAVSDLGPDDDYILPCINKYYLIKGFI